MAKSMTITEIEAAANARIAEMDAHTSDILRDLATDAEGALDGWYTVKVDKKGVERTVATDLAPSARLGTDRADNVRDREADALKKVVSAGTASRRTVLRAALDAAPILREWPAARVTPVFGASSVVISQVKRGLDRTAVYDAHDVPEDARWSWTDRDKRRAPDWDKHIADLTATPEAEAEGGAEGDDDTPATPKPVTVAQVVKALQAAADKVARLGDVDDVEAADIANAMAALVDATSKYADA